MKLIRDAGIKYPTEKSKQKKRFGIFECFYCGKHFEVQVTSVTNGYTKSCGCLQSNFARNQFLTHGLSNTRIFKIYEAMKTRCYNKNRRCFKDYGGRGITVCDEWRNDFLKFYKWSVNNGYANNLEIDRKNNNEGYSPDNCRWATRSEQMQNTRLLSKNNSSGYRGVVFFKKNNKWASRITVNNKKYYFGLFSSPELAAQAYNNFVIENKTLHPLNILP